MGKTAKILTVTGSVIAGGVILSLAYLFYFLPDAGPAPEISITATPEMLARGEYLANHVAVCIDCHSTRDWNNFAGPVVPGTEGKGGERFDKSLGFPGAFYSRNITAYGIGDWTDGEIFRLITTGVDKDGEPIFPVMPAYRTMDPNDVKAIIAYIRTLDPIEYSPPESQATFPMNLIMRTIPKPSHMRPAPAKSDTVSYGKYLVEIAACGDCHTPREKGHPIEGMHLAGGFAMPLPTGGVARSANLTSDPETGLGAWNKDLFIQRFKAYEDPSMKEFPVGKGEFNSYMPWTMYSGMTEEDLGAIFAYLQTVKPVKNEVAAFTAE